MKKFLIVANLNKENSACIANKVKKALDEKGAKADVFSYDVFEEKNVKAICENAEKAECIIIVGGDGTLLRTSRAISGLNKPILGVNSGHLGFLCDVDEERIDEAVEKLLSGNITIENRMMLEGTVNNETRLSLNDAVIFRSGQLRTIALKVYVDSQLLTIIHGDGIVIATPTGSTGYSMSCGGPILDPSSEMIVMTPCAPHSLSMRSVVLNPDSFIEIEIEDHDETVNKGDILLSFDGENAIKVDNKSKIKIKRAKDCIKLIRIRQTGFLELLHNKMGS